MVEMPMMPTQPAADPIVPDVGAPIADAPKGAFEEMLARRLGRQLIGRHGEDDDGAGAGAGAGPGGHSQPWMPPRAAMALTATQDAAGTLGSPSVGASPSLQEAAGTSPTAAASDSAGRTAPGAALPPAGDAPIKLTVNRPGFRIPMAEAGIIEPGPLGEVWTHPSGFADLELTPSAAGRTAGPAGGAPVESVPEPPEVRWSPAPARAALAAAANRDLELEIVTQLRNGLETAQAKPRLEVVKAGAGDSAEPGRILFDVANVDDAAGRPIAAAAPTGAPASVVAGGGAPSPNPSSLIDRVVNAVEMQRHLPPPRAIAVEIPEMEGLRLLVTMRMDGTVHVAPSTSGQGAMPAQAAPLLQAVNEALTQRGFDMNADTGGRRDARDRTEDAPVPTRPGRYRRPAQRSGLRI